MIGNANIKSTKAHRDELEEFMIAHAEMAGWDRPTDRATEKSWAIKAKPGQVEIGGDGFEHDTNEACEEFAQELATAKVDD